jgi:hypothetical protein
MMEPVAPPPPPQFDDKALDKHQCILEFRGFLQRRDSHGLEAVMHALDRLDCGAKLSVDRLLVRELAGRNILAIARLCLGSCHHSSNK